MRVASTSSPLAMTRSPRARKDWLRKNGSGANSMKAPAKGATSALPVRKRPRSSSHPPLSRTYSKPTPASAALVHSHSMFVIDTLRQELRQTPHVGCGGGELDRGDAHITARLTGRHPFQNGPPPGVGRLSSAALARSGQGSRAFPRQVQTTRRKKTPPAYARSRSRIGWWGFLLSDQGRDFVLGAGEAACEVCWRSLLAFTKSSLTP